MITNDHWEVRASSAHPGGGEAAKHDLSRIYREHYKWLYAGAMLILYDSLPTSSQGGVDTTKFDSVLWFSDVWGKGTEDFVPSNNLSGGTGPCWRGPNTVFQQAPIAWSRQARRGFNETSGNGRSPPNQG